MTNDRYLFELAVHVKLASEAIVAAARDLVALRPDATGETAAAWSRTMDDLALMNVELGFMEKIVRDATRGRRATGRLDIPRPSRRAV